MFFFPHLRYDISVPCVNSCLWNCIVSMPAAIARMQLRRIRAINICRIAIKSILYWSYSKSPFHFYKVESFNLQNSILNSTSDENNLTALANICQVKLWVRICNASGPTPEGVSDSFDTSHVQWRGGHVSSAENGNFLCSTCGGSAGELCEPKSSTSGWISSYCLFLAFFSPSIGKKTFKEPQWKTFAPFWF